MSVSTLKDCACVIIGKFLSLGRLACGMTERVALTSMSESYGYRIERD